MKTAEQIKAKSDEIVTAYEVGIKKCESLEQLGLINSSMTAGVIAMLAEIAMQLADMNERARQRSDDTPDGEALAAHLLRELREDVTA